MDDEVRIFAEHRPEAPPYPERARQALRARLLGQPAGRPRRSRAWGVAGPLAAVFALTGVLVGGVAIVASGGPGDTQWATTSDLPELDPRPGQLIVTETLRQALDSATSARTWSSWYERSWQPVEPAGAGLVETGRRGRPVQPMRRPADFQVAPCAKLPEQARSDYALLRTLPTEPAAMRAYLVERLGGDTSPVGRGEIERLLQELYAPLPQRRAVFEALKGWPGYRVIEGTRDALGRAGTALGFEHEGELRELIFDPQSYLLLGARRTLTVADGTLPVGTVKYLSARVRHELVPAPEGLGGGGCLVAPKPAPGSWDAAWYTPRPYTDTLSSTVPPLPSTLPPPSSEPAIVSPTPGPGVPTFSPSPTPSG
ncbi:hypothetical protein [Nonomuraea sp. NPDC050310]|uniref:hypothetical protein n=1 Tax=Nonomuraea sp. NPDC050310 TaxID=3154935 RepID=UPI0033EF101D